MLNRVAALVATFCVLFVCLMQSSCGSAGASALAPNDLLVVADHQPPDDLDPASWGEKLAASAAQPLVVLTDPGELPLIKVVGETERKLPLEHTKVKAHLAGFMAKVEVTQRYGNPFDEPIEVVYVFPLPENSAVNFMKMVIGEREVRAKIEERQRARRIYVQAKRRGHTAALLEQERPNIFTQSIANIAPGEKIDVVIRYLQDLSYDAGRYEFVFPMVVGPRFIPGTPLQDALSGKGTYSDTDEVPDASRITPPVLGKGERSGHDISLELTAEAGLAVGDFEVPTHDVLVRKPEDGSLQMSLANKESIPNRDFVLRYRVDGAEPLATLLTSGGDKEGYFALMIHPPRLDVEQLVGRREIIFVVDVSGSMSGVPLGLCRLAMRDALSRLRPVDTFNIITFAGRTAKAFERPQPANRNNLAKALELIDSVRAGGGTYMANAVRDALGTTVGKGRHRYVFFLTDGHIGNEKAIFAGASELVAALEARGQRARVFGFGVGSSPNRHLLEGLSDAGKGIAVYASAREHPAAAVDRFYRYIDRAVLTDLDISWGNLGGAEIYPNPPPDLFASHPVILHGRYESMSTQDPISLHARAGEKQVKIPVKVIRSAASSGPKGGMLGALWARSKVASLEADSWTGRQRDAATKILELGLGYQLVTAQTSLIAVDRSRVVGNGKPRTIMQPVEVPEGVDGVAAGARTHMPVAEAAARPKPSRPEALSAEPMMSPPAPPTEPEGYEDVALDRSERGCFCRAVGPSGNERNWFWLLGLVMASCWLRGRARGPAASSSGWPRLWRDR